MPQFYQTPRGYQLAYHYTPPKNTDLPTVVFLGGFMSDMQGSKATEFERLCTERGQGYLRFDYSGHGQSEQEFTQGTIGIWAKDAYDLISAVTEDQPLILVGSSMGGWIALLTALRLKSQVQSIIGIAAAPDFTKEMHDERLTEVQKQEVSENGITYIPSDYGAPYPITKALLEDGKTHCLLHDKINLECPVRLLQGTEDHIVPSDKPERIAKALTSIDVSIEWFEGGDHSLSRPEDIQKIDACIQSLSSVQAYTSTSA